MHPRVERQLMERNRAAQREFIARMRAQLREDSESGRTDPSEGQASRPEEPGERPEPTPQDATHGGRCALRRRVDTFMDRLVRQRRLGG